MEVQLTSTSKIVTLNGVECRVWEGTTKGGIPCHAYIPRIAAREHLNLEEFERDLTEHQTPSLEIESIPARMVL
jgi:hypothetical protein